MKNRKANKLFGALLLVAFLVAVFAGGLYAAPKEERANVSKAKAIQVKAWDCAGCHKDKKIIPDNHIAIKEMSYTGCLMCHVPGEGKAGTLKSKIPGSHLHAFKGIQCAQCHGKVKKPEPVEMSRCATCHDAVKLAEKTKDIKPSNPHTSPHYGTDLDCNLCHHQHAKSENYCARCHKFNFIVP